MAQKNAFTHSHRVLGDDAVAFRCSADQTRWPWLALEPRHPIVVQSINFQTLFETGTTLGAFDRAKPAALTTTRWICGDAGVGRVTHGVAAYPKPAEGETRRSFHLTFFDAGGDLVCRLGGDAAVFRARDFASWRKEAKQSAEAAPKAFAYAAAEALGVASDVERFLSPLRTDGPPSAEGLVAKETGFIPQHPYHSGTGDHVNAHQLADAGLQFLSLVRGGDARPCVGGDIAFKRYVELDRPFTITEAAPGTRTGADEEANVVSMTICQDERICTEMTFRLAGAPARPSRRSDG